MPFAKRKAPSQEVGKGGSGSNSRDEPAARLAPSCRQNRFLSTPEAENLMRNLRDGVGNTFNGSALMPVHAEAFGDVGSISLATQAWCYHDDTVSAVCMRKDGSKSRHG